ncbi:polysaccharide deacetylase family protein [Lentibacillus saliphilus]|uniref:polysaccharide deacetylase family protein n=1 Tax=Lentibacillus saliphilus TaxID=2737028 RepID=UPI001C2F9303|nr:polysaccharide deacetylase family protein [Lentibacillus saliphilus]
MSITPQKKTRLNHWGKLVLGILIVCTLVVLLFISNQMVVADQSIGASITNDDRETAGSEKETESPKEDTTPHEDPTHSEEEKNDVEQNEDVQNKEEQTEDEPSEQPIETGKVVYLTFDDGPHPNASADILQLLDKYDAKATFFMLEPNMTRNPEIIKSMHEKGHSLGVHGVTHQISNVYKSPEHFVNEMNQAIGFIEETVGVNTHLVRAPYGSKPYITPPFKTAANHNQLIIWDWNVDSRDWQYKNGEFVENTIQQINERFNKEPLVVLMHEKPTTAAHLEKLLHYFVDNGYEMKAIHEEMTPVQFGV